MMTFRVTWASDLSRMDFWKVSSLSELRDLSKAEGADIQIEWAPGQKIEEGNMSKGMDFDATVIIVDDYL